MKSCCADFKPNMDKINGYISFVALRQARTDSSGKILKDQNLGYDGKKFKYCPWCGKEFKLSQLGSTVVCVETSPGRYAKIPKVLKDKK